MLPTTTLAVAAILGITSALPNSAGQTRVNASKDTWDYVIVGGGVTGLVVANRLTEDKKSKLRCVHPAIEFRSVLFRSVLIRAHRKRSRYRGWRSI
jgi:hypothetical protein